jgi:hypothetical protein
MEPDGVGKGAGVGVAVGGGMETGTGRGGAVLGGEEGEEGMGGEVEVGAVLDGESPRCCLRATGGGRSTLPGGACWLEDAFML